MRSAKNNVSRVSELARYKIRQEPYDLSVIVYLKMVDRGRHIFAAPLVNNLELHETSRRANSSKARHPVPPGLRAAHQSHVRGGHLPTVMNCRPVWTEIVCRFREKVTNVSELKAT
jgi:hypothetical protein